MTVRKFPSQQPLTGEQELATSGSVESSFPYRSSGWRLEQPSPREFMERLAVATLAAQIGVWDLDVPSDSVVWCSRCAKMFGAGLEPGSWKERVLDRIHPEDQNQVQSAMEAALDPSGTGVLHSDYRVVLPDGEIRWIASNGKAFFEHVEGRRKPIRLVGTLLDRTKHELAHLALVQSEKLAVTGRLAVSIAHEIRNPLDSVSNLLHIIGDEPSAEKRIEYVALAKVELMRVHDIASNTLRLYRNPSGVLTVDLAAVIDSVLVLFRGRISPQQVRVQTELPTCVGVKAPEAELRQVLINLIGNALDAMPKGGRLILRARVLTGKAGNKCVRLTIADTGVGMPPGVVSRVFEAFYTTKNGSGTGIGLWLSQEIVKKCGSKMHVKSILGRGTVFSMYLPGLHTDEQLAHQDCE
jgi:signal transduction histidine kinase